MQNAAQLLVDKVASLCVAGVRPKFMQHLFYD
jgi:hypothetical protein